MRGPSALISTLPCGTLSIEVGDETYDKSHFTPSIWGPLDNMNLRDKRRGLLVGAAFEFTAFCQGELTNQSTVPIVVHKMHPY